MNSTIESIIDHEKQEVFKKNKLVVFHPSEEQTEYLLKSNGWVKSSINCSLNYSSNRFFEMEVLHIGKLIFYRPIEPYNNAEFENFFGFGCKCSGFTKNRIRFSYGHV